MYEQSADLFFEEEEFDEDQEKVLGESYYLHI